MKVHWKGETRDIWTLWREGTEVKMIDQRVLPHKFEILTFKNFKETADSIRDMVCRGAGAIGCAAGYSMAQAALEANEMEVAQFTDYLENAASYAYGTRPTAVNLFQAVERCLEAGSMGDVNERVEKVVEEADRIAEEDLEASKKMGEHGSELIGDDYRILTHCNAGALAFIDFGTALSPIRFAQKQGKRPFVWVDETRPRCQGARLTAWELMQEGIDYALIVDNAAGYFMQRGEVDIVIVGADRVTANADVVNKIGTYEKAVVAKENDIPFYVAAPRMTFDLKTETGWEVEIEERSHEEVTRMWGKINEDELKDVQIPADGTVARNPSFDITPARYISGFITEEGIIKPPFEENIRKTFQ
ncbi:S-methyl-5-thioribose-1-phosphate isomerase [Candidatus Bathyarchaeota archaeon]|nr:S-methyl-5-thioribose-1-phosphate isomerase [Candidatus Bathyarchaeota archaeon]